MVTPGLTGSTSREATTQFGNNLAEATRGDEVVIFDHPNQERYPGQKVSVVLIEGYAYLVPFVESEAEIFLKTIIPSRKATRQYIGESDE